MCAKGGRQSEIVDYITGKRESLMVTKLHENYFFNHCVSCWIFLPPAVVNASSISCFLNAFYLTLICQLLQIVLISIIFKGPA